MSIIIKEKLGRFRNANTKQVEKLYLEWFETGKRILHKQTSAGRPVVMKFLRENPLLSHDDVVYEDEQTVVVIDILPCEAIAVAPANMFEMARLCYEIGNKHLPLFYDDGTLLIPYDEPLFKWLLSAGFEPVKENRRLLNQLRTSVAAHGHNGNSSLLSRILNLTND
jgi:urease accessory protein